MVAAASMSIPSLKRPMSHATKRERSGTPGLGPSQQAMRNAELTLVAFIFAPSKRSTHFLDSRMMKLIYSSGLIA